MFSRIDAGAFSSDTVNTGCLLSATHFVVGTQAGDIGYTTNKGVSWTRLVAPVAGVASWFNIVTNGTNLVANGQNGSTFYLASSTDGGATWTNVTPGGSSAANLFYSTLTGEFIAFDFTTNAVYTSSDGVTWATHSTPYLVEVASFLSQSSDALCISAIKISTENSLVVWRSGDGITWVERYNSGTTTDALVIPQGLYDGIDFYSLQWDQTTNGVTLQRSSDDGVTWALASGTTSSSTPPFFVGGIYPLATLGGDLYCYPDTTGVRYAVSSDHGSTWTAHTISSGSFTGGGSIYDYNSVLYATGNDVVQSTDGLAWTSEIGTIYGGNIISMSFGFTYALAFGIDDSGNGGVWASFSASATVPNVVDDSLGDATAAIVAASVDPIFLTVGTVSAVVDATAAIGSVVSQDPAAGTEVTESTPVDLEICVSNDGSLEGFDIAVTVISQYANSPQLLQLVANMVPYFDQTVNFAQFYGYIWNVATAEGFGLDIWGKIVNVSRLLEVSGSVVTLDDSDYRVLIYAKALANISTMSAPAYNQLLRNVFAGQRVYSQDTGDMTMEIVFNFTPTPTQLAIVENSGVFPHPAGVLLNVVSVLPSTFGFSPGDWLGFNQGPFNPG